MENGGSTAKVKVAGLLFDPGRSLPVVAAAQLSTRQLLFRYVLTFGAIPALATMIGTAVFGIPVSSVFFHPGLLATVVVGLVIYVITIAVVLAMSGVIHGFASVFDGDERYSQALKLALLASLPGWIGSLALIAPGLGIIPAMANLYGFYLLGRGISPVMGVTKERAVVYGALVIVIFALLWAIASFATAAVSRVGLIPEPGQTLPTGRLVLPGVGSMNLKQASDSLKQLHADRNATGEPAPPTPPHELEALMPPELASGHKRVEMSSRTASVGRLSGSTANGVFVLNASRISLTLSDAGAAKALIDAVTLNGSRESADGYEKSGLVDGRPTMERYNRVNHAGEYSVVVAGRYVVQAKGTADVATLKAAVEAISFERLEAFAKG